MTRSTPSPGRRRAAGGWERGPAPPAGRAWAELPLHTTIPVPPGVSGMPEDHRLLPALAMALRRPAHGLLRTNLMPDELRPRPFRWPLAVTGGLAAATLLLALAIPAVTMIPDERRLPRPGPPPPP